MAGTAIVGWTDDQDIDGLLSGVRWDTTSLTYSFPTSGAFYGADYGWWGVHDWSGAPNTNFEALNATQQAAVNTILRMYESVTDLKFTLTTEGATNHAVLRFAMTDDDDVPTAEGAPPLPVGEEGGDSWYHNTGGRYDNPVRGNSAYRGFMHEIGHTLGLMHGHESNIYGSMTAAHDSMEYSVTVGSGRNLGQDACLSRAGRPG